MHWNEETYIEILFCHELTKLGWSILSLNIHQTPADSYRESFREIIIEPEIRRALATINPWLEEDQITELVTRLQAFTSSPLIGKNHELTDLLINFTTIHEYRKDAAQSPTVKYIDFENIENNRFLAIRQFKIAIPDITLFVNGIPLVVVECKYPDILEPVSEAITQIFRYQDSREAYEPEGNPLLFVHNLFSIATTAENARFWNIGGKEEHYLEWKDPYPVAISSINPDGRTPDSQQNFIHGIITGNLHIKQQNAQYQGIPTTKPVHKKVKRMFPGIPNDLTQNHWIIHPFYQIYAVSRKLQPLVGEVFYLIRNPNYHNTFLYQTLYSRCVSERLNPFRSISLISGLIWRHITAVRIPATLIPSLPLETL